MFPVHNGTSTLNSKLNNEYYDEVADHAEKKYLATVYNAVTRIDSAVEEIKEDISESDVLDRNTFGCLYSILNNISDCTLDLQNGYHTVGISCDSEESTAVEEYFYSASNDLRTDIIRLFDRCQDKVVEMIDALDDVRESDNNAACMVEGLYDSVITLYDVFESCLIA